MGRSPHSGILRSSVALLLKQGRFRGTTKGIMGEGNEQDQARQQPLSRRELRQIALAKAAELAAQEAPELNVESAYRYYPRTGQIDLRGVNPTPTPPYPNPNRPPYPAGSAPETTPREQVQAQLAAGTQAPAAPWTSTNTGAQDIVRGPRIPGARPAGWPAQDAGTNARATGAPAGGFGATPQSVAPASTPLSNGSNPPTGGIALVYGRGGLRATNTGPTVVQNAQAPATNSGFGGAATSNTSNADAYPQASAEEPHFGTHTATAVVERERTNTGTITTVAPLDPTPAATPQTAARTRRERPGVATIARNTLTSPAFLLGTLATVLIALGSWFPSFTYGESSVLSGAHRSFQDVIDLIANGHATHGLWTAFMWLWANLVGGSEFMVRLPSAVGAGLAVSAVVLVGQRAGSLTIGVISGIVMMVLPRTTDVGMTAEGFALELAAASWSTVALLWAVGAVAHDPVLSFEVPRSLVPPHLRQQRAAALRRCAGRWAVYALLVILAAYAFPTGATMLIVHPAVLLVAGARRHAFREWFIAAMCCLVIIAPLLIVTVLQGGLDWRAEAKVGGIGPWLLSIYGAGPFGWIPLIPIALALIAGIVNLREITNRFGRTLLELSVAWFITPMLLLGGLALLGMPIHPDYLSASAPALALLVGLSLAASRRWIMWALAGAIVLAAVPSYGSQRMPGGLHDTDGREVSSFVAAHAAPGDGMLFIGEAPLTDPRTILEAYPSNFEGLTDVAIAQPAEYMDELWDETLSSSMAGLRLDGINRVWLVRELDDPLLSTDPDLEAFRNEGFAVTQATNFRTHAVYEVVRTESFGLQEDGTPPAGQELPPVPVAPETPYADPNKPDPNAQTTIGPDGVPTAVPSETPDDGGAVDLDGDGVIDNPDGAGETDGTGGAGETGGAPQPTP